MCRKFKSSSLNMRYSNGVAKGQFELRGDAGVGDINLGVICIYMVFKVMDLDQIIQEEQQTVKKPRVLPTFRT